jgi:hypothetical protein
LAEEQRKVLAVKHNSPLGLHWGSGRGHRVIVLNAAVNFLADGAMAFGLPAAIQQR